MPIDQTDPEDRDVLTRSAPDPTREWAYGSGPDQVADVYLPESAVGRPVVLVHGGFWRPEYDRLHLRPLAAALAIAGYPVVSLEYRREPGNPDVSIDDLRDALDHLALAPPPGWPSSAPILVGHSAGGHLVLLLAATSPERIGACVALAPVADLSMGEELGLDNDAVVAFLGGAARTRPDLDPTSRKPQVPVTVLHGSADRIVPMELSESYAATAPAVVLQGLTAATHFALIDPLTTAFGELLTALASPGIE